MKSISSVQVAQLVNEFKQIVGARIDKVYQKKDQFFIVVKKSGEKKKILAIILPHAIFFSSKKPEMGLPEPFCSKLRKLVERALILDIKQVNTERIIELTLSTREGTKLMMVELFSKGNVIVCDQEKIIILPFKSQTWKDRTLKRGQVYQLPPARVTPLNTPKDKWCEELLKQEIKNISAYLATQAGLGGVFATLLCEQLNIDPKAQKITLEQAQLLYEGHKNLYTTFTKKALSEQLEQEWEKEIKQDTPVDKKQKKILSIIHSQEASIKKLQEEATQNNKKGELIYAQYQQIQKILDKAKQTRNLKELLGHPKVSKVDPKNKTITIEIEDEM